MIGQDSWGSDSGYRGRRRPSLHWALLEEAFCLRQAWAGIHGETMDGKEPSGRENRIYVRGRLDWTGRLQRNPRWLPVTATQGEGGGSGWKVNYDEQGAENQEGCGRRGLNYRPELCQNFKASHVGVLARCPRLEVLPSR